MAQELGWSGPLSKRNMCFSEAYNQNLKAFVKEYVLEELKKLRRWDECSPQSVSSWLKQIPHVCEVYLHLEQHTVFCQSPRLEFQA